MSLVLVDTSAWARVHEPAVGSSVDAVGGGISAITRA